MSNIRRIVIPEFVIGPGSRYQVGTYIQNLGSKHVLLVTDKVVRECGHVESVEEKLSEYGIKYTLYDEISQNPRDYEVHKGAKLYIENLCDSIVAIGGGSVLDCAKGIAVIATNGGYISDYEGIDMVSEPIPPMVCIPTTSGTSADVSQFAIITNTEHKYKMALISKMLVPDVALIDSETLLTMPDELTAATGMDALTHAIESLVSTASCAFTDVHSFDAAEIIFNNLHPCLQDPFNMEYRSELMRASMEAGVAFSNASLGAVHAIAHSVGGFLNQPHGICNAVLLPYVVAYNFDSSPDKYIKLSKMIGFEGDMNDLTMGKEYLLNKIKSLNQSLGTNKTLKSMGVTFEIMDQLSIRALNDPCMVTNPKEMDIHDVRSILEEAF